EAIARHKKFETEGKDFMYAFMEKINQGTSNSAVLFALIQVLRDRAMQDRIHQEIDQVLGEDMPCWADNHRLPYTAAFLQESLRYYTIAPLAGPRRILRETVLDGYTIPKDTTVLISLGDIHSDPQYWEEPHVFKPERCPGDPLARAFIFITFVGLLQRYLLTCEVMPSPDPEPGMLQAPKPFTA
ncbi:Cytochrome P450, partial [Operophtera brumata]